MQVTICGPNLVDQSKGSFHVHAAGCADLVRHARREPEYAHGWTVDVDSRLDATEAVFEDIMSDDDSPASAYVHELHFFPCCDALPHES